MKAKRRIPPNRSVRWVDQWYPPIGSSAYFSISSDDEFKGRHPVGYWFLVALGILVLFLPFLLYSLYAFSVNPDGNAWLTLGWAGAFIVGIGLFNFVSIIIKQYLGHLVSILSFLIGGVMIAVSLRFL